MRALCTAGLLYHIYMLEQEAWLINWKRFRLESTTFGRFLLLFTREISDSFQCLLQVHYNKKKKTTFQATYIGMSCTRASRAGAELNLFTICSHFAVILCCILVINKGDKWGRCLEYVAKRKRLLSHLFSSTPVWQYVLCIWLISFCSRRRRPGELQPLSIRSDCLTWKYTC